MKGPAKGAFLLKTANIGVFANPDWPLNQQMKFKLALIQMRVEPGRVERNLEHAEERIKEAASHRADVVLLPEALDAGWTCPKARELAQPIPGGGPALWFSDSACRYGLWICVGLTERAGNQVYNSAALFDPVGTMVSLHRKLNELTIAHPYYDQGDRLSIVSTDWGNFGLVLCADAFARDRVLTRSLCYMGADVILSPCAWAVEESHDNAATPYGSLWHDAYIPVAKEFGVWIAAVSNVGPISGGPWRGRKCIGSSMVIDPHGREVARGPYGVDAEAILYAEISPAPRRSRGCGWDV